MTLDPYYGYFVGGDKAFTVDAPKIKFGAGSLSEIGEDARSQNISRIALFTDPVVSNLQPTEIARTSLEVAKIDVTIFDEIEIEPTDRSFKAAIQFAINGNFDGFASVGGGSVIDTAKAANLYSTYPDDFLAYINAPIGSAKPVPGPLKPHIACPTTFGTASECTGIAVCDMLDLKAKTGIANARLKPSLGILDPNSLTTLPRPVVAANGFDVFSHAIESLTARPFSQRPAPENPDLRPLGQGANPYSDLACHESIRLIGENLISAVNNDDNTENLEALMFASMLAGIGFGNAGCHLPHAMSYAVAGLTNKFQASGWPTNNPIVPHGISVIVNAPAVFRYTGPACPERHLKAAEAMGVDISGAKLNEAGNILADQVVQMMRITGIPNGNSEIGYKESDLDTLSEKAFLQQRLLLNSPLVPDLKQLRNLFYDSLSYW
ncbi:MAG: hydroxyacid-oxoacid transhydrogenase [Pseudomonadota bacterium]|nr:hydroxyacid-oxoacid transhydrogenase [Pseudomonadota bacterium]